MKTTIPFLLMFILFISGCSNSTVPPIGYRVALLSGFGNGVSTVSSYSGGKILYSTPFLNVSSFDTIEVSFNYSHFGNYPKTFLYNQYLVWHGRAEVLLKPWEDTLTRGTKSRVVKIWNSNTYSGLNDSASFRIEAINDTTLVPSPSPPDSTYLHNLSVVGWRKN